MTLDSWQAFTVGWAVAVFVCMFVYWLVHRDL